jgi:hypothetical protein
MRGETAESMVYYVDKIQELETELSRLRESETELIRLRSLRSDKKLARDKGGHTAQYLTQSVGSCLCWNYKETKFGRA